MLEVSDEELSLFSAHTRPFDESRVYTNDIDCLLDHVFVYRDCKSNAGTLAAGEERLLIKAMNMLTQAHALVEEVESMLIEYRNNAQK